MVAWTTPDLVADALGPGAGDDFLVSPYALACVDAANEVCYRKRMEAGYVDPPDPLAPAPGPDVAMGATLYTVALWRERASTDGYASFEDLTSYTPTGGSWGQVKRLLGIGRAQTDGPLTPVDLDAVRAAAASRRRRPATWRKYL